MIYFFAVRKICFDYFQNNSPYYRTSGKIEVETNTLAEQVFVVK